MSTIGNKPRAGVFSFGPYRLNALGRTLTREGRDVVLGSRAFDLLVALVQRQGDMLSRRELMQFAWSGLSVEDSNLRVQIAHLRREIGCGDHGIRYIASVAGRGYSFVAPVKWNEETVPEPVGIERSRFLPYQPKRNFGRDDDVAGLCRALEERRFLTVVGPGGVGKTTLAAIVAHTLRNFPMIYFVDLGAVEAGAGVGAFVTSALDLPSDSTDPADEIVERLGGMPALVILDNCEHVIDAVGEVVLPVLKETSTIQFLLTSREALRLPGEAVYLLRPLGAPPYTGPLSAKQALEWPAVALFMERAADGGRYRELSDDEAVTVAAICRRLDGNPLAIELVASRVGTYGLERVAELLDDQLSLCWRGNRSAVPRHRTVEAMLGWSYDLLSETSRKVFARLSVFPGGFSLAGAAVVAGDDDMAPRDVAHAIGDLVDKSLLSIEAGPGPEQLKLLGVTRTFAAMKLVESGESGKVQRRHAIFQRERQPRNGFIEEFALADARGAGGCQNHF